MRILGLNHDMYISSAALLVDGRIVAATPEERFTRSKHTRAFPQNAIQYCLNEADVAIEEIDYIANAWNPAIYFSSFNPLISTNRRFKHEYLISVPDNILAMSDLTDQSPKYVMQKIPYQDFEQTFYYITHHMTHAANAFFTSPFDDAAIFTADSQGEIQSTTFGYGNDNNLTTLKSINHPHSLGAFYATFTEYLGYRAHSDEWKVMALAAYSDKEDRTYYDLISNNLITKFEDGSYELNLMYFKDFIFDQPNLYTDALINLLGPARKSNTPFESRHYQIAAAMQKIIEETVFNSLTALQKETNSRNLVLAGGLFMNSLMNGKISAMTPFENIYIPSCPDDSGNSIGAALYLYHNILKNKSPQPLHHTYLGPEFSNKEIKMAMEKVGLKAKKFDNIEIEAAKLLANGALIGWFQGRMEFGQRALGNRSILADPRDVSIKKRINQTIKSREGFRPFAPSILKDRVAEYFDVTEGTEVPYMEKVFPIRAERQSEIPAVTHEDGTGRVQTVSKEINPKFYQLIEAFDKITGTPILLNTSFNINGEPIVYSPDDALKTFFSCGLTVLVMGDYLLTKSDEIG